MDNISKPLETKLQEQIGHEYHNSRVYRAMSEWAKFNGLNGMAKLLYSYSEEEVDHAKAFYDYLQDRDVLPITPPLDKVQIEFKDMEEIIPLIYKTEITTSAQIDLIYEMAVKDSDHATAEFAFEFVKEQVSEEAKALYWVDRLKAYKQTNSPLILLDKEMKHKA